MRGHLIFGIFLICTSPSALAEGACPPGHYQTTPAGPQGPIGCAPIPESSRSKVTWLDRWGAISTDSNGNWGIVSEKPSKKIARKMAIDECHKRGGSNCKIALIYVNQCSAVVANKGASGVARAPTVEDAIEDATSTCNKINNGQRCGVYYSGCSLPVKVGG